jgi:hypothetical protein
MRLSARLYVVPVLRMHGALPPFPIHLHGVVQHNDNCVVCSSGAVWCPSDHVVS